MEKTVAVFKHAGDDFFDIGKFLILGAIIAGVAGALYVPQVGIINPGEFSPVNSIEIVIRVLRHHSHGHIGCLNKRPCNRTE